MALSIGSAAVGTGMAGAIIAQLDLAFSIPTQGRPDAEKMADALATAIVTHIKDNADVIIKTSDSALQELGGFPTDGPTADRTLSGAVD